jgi:hypothetical protein
LPFCGYNCNTNFGGAARKGTNTFCQAKDQQFKVNIQGTGCATHVFHNALQTSAYIPPNDVEAIVNKIFQYFHMNTVQVEELKEFCNFIDVECKQILGSVKTRWL